MFAIGLDIGYSNLKLAYEEVPDSGTPKPAVTQVLPAGAGRLPNLPLRMGKADGDTDALVVNVNGEKWVYTGSRPRLGTSNGTLSRCRKHLIASPAGVYGVRVAAEPKT